MQVAYDDVGDDDHVHDHDGDDDDHHDDCDDDKCKSCFSVHGWIPIHVAPFTLPSASLKPWQQQTDIFFEECKCNDSKDILRIIDQKKYF